ncbi:hypothetical protein [Paenibacillus sp. KN14-4R]|uniref:hypothetical protein n=1 Tax=Paenibacillus sp. KN14-4R TaxID=3445773 RepID=UPI003F9F5E79
MSYFCEVCNGLENLTASCPHCHAEAQDFGPYNDYLGPYAPYRSMDVLSFTNGLADLQQHTCVHMMSCPLCDHTFQLSVYVRSY